MLMPLKLKDAEIGAYHIARRYLTLLVAEFYTQKRTRPLRELAATIPRFFFRAKGGHVSPRMDSSCHQVGLSPDEICDWRPLTLAAAIAVLLHR